MATVIDALLVTLGLDPSGLKKGGREARQEMKDIKTGTNDLSGAFKDLKGAISEVLIVMGSMYAIKKVVLDTLALDASVSRLAKNLDMQPGKLMAWGNAMKAIGGTAEDANGMLLNVSRTQSELRLTGDSGMIPYLRALGVSMANAQGKALPASEVLLQIGDRLQSMSQRQGRSFAYGFASQMGFNDNQINMLLKGRKAMRDMIAEEERLRPFNARQAEAAEKAQKAWSNLGVAWSEVAQKITDVLLPAMQAGMPIVEKGLSWIANNKAVIIGGLVAFGAVLTAVVAPAVWAAVAAAWAFWAALMANPITWVVQAIAALAFGIYKLIQSWKAWVDGEPNKFWDDWAPVIYKVKDAWNAVTGSIERATEALGKWYDKHLKKTVDKAWSATKTEAVKLYHAGLEGLKQMIGAGEGDYDSVNLGKSKGYRAAKRDLEHMTVDQVLSAQGHGEFRAAGKYQMMPETLKEAKSSMGLRGSELFNKETQDKIFTSYLLGTRRKELADYLSGRSNNLQAALIALSKEWASVADPRTGKSFYSGVGNNKATISAAEASRVLQSARQQQIQQHNSHKYSRVETNIGSINVHTPATNGHEVAHDIRREIRNNGLIAQADYGLV